ncbi:hypothetical protein U737_19920 [Methylomonas sp. LW13]|uniref:DUF5681 domain-containing protein n=1 Tax=unclassified Methylomonas TaxID=2608980 RepID=UPI00051B2604|nr:DUF5681 domain-containing protein [Methylomonas sp. LW13]QBC28988.1 hypothetical protein U737_19920 [Methylomonas sp. LW13]
MPTPKFKPGQSGNPNGRPKGKSAGGMVRKAIEERREDILKVVMDAALNGDLQACKTLLDRIAPTLRPVAASVAITLNKSAGLAEQGAEVVNAALSGNVPPDVANQLISVLTHQGKLIETTELIARVEALESRQ